MTIYRLIIDGSSAILTEITVLSIGLLTGDYKCERFYYLINVDVLHFPKVKFGGTSVLLNKYGDLQGL